MTAKGPVAINSIVYRVRLIWPDAQWVLREPPGVKASLTWRGGPSVEEVGEELRWPDIEYRRTVRRPRQAFFWPFLPNRFVKTG